MVVWYLAVCVGGVIGGLVSFFVCLWCLFLAVGDMEITLASSPEANAYLPETHRNTQMTPGRVNQTCDSSSELTVDFMVVS